MRTDLSTRLILLIFLSSGIPLLGQESRPGPSRQEVEQRKEREASRTGIERSRPPTSFSESVFSTLRNKATFSFGIYETYTSDILSEFFVSSNGNPDTITSFYSRFFTNVERRKSLFTMDYAAGYRMYGRSSGLDAPEHRGNLSFSFKPTRQWAVEFNERISSEPNDLSSPLIQSGAPDFETGFSQEIFYTRQRVFRNYLETRVGYRLTPQTQFKVFGAHLIEQYSNRSSFNTNGFLAGFGVEKHLTRWLAFNMDYAFKLSRFNHDFNEGRTHRLRLGGFNYKPRRTLTLFASGGLELTDFQGAMQPGFSFQGGIENNTPSTLAALQYEHGATNAYGLGTMLRTHSVAVRLNRRFTPWLKLLTSTSYSRSTSLNSRSTTIIPSEPVMFFNAQPRLEFTLRRNLTMSLKYDYLNQQAGDFVLRLPNASRYLVTFGFEYVFASLNQR
jgi:hypothetical protein